MNAIEEAAALANKVQAGDESGVGRLNKLHEALYVGYVERHLRSARYRPGLKSGILDPNDFFLGFHEMMLRNLRKSRFRGGNYGAWLLVCVKHKLIDYVGDSSILKEGDDWDAPSNPEREPNRRKEEKPAGHAVKGISKLVPLQELAFDDEDGPRFEEFVRDERTGDPSDSIQFYVVLNDYLRALKAIRNPDHAAAFYTRIFLGKEHPQVVSLLGLESVSTARGNFHRAVMDIQSWFEQQADYEGLSTSGLAEFALRNFIIEDRDLDKIESEKLREVLRRVRNHTGGVAEFADDLGVSQEEALKLIRQGVVALSRVDLDRQGSVRIKVDLPAITDQQACERLWMFVAGMLDTLRAPSRSPDGWVCRPREAEHSEVCARVLFRAFAFFPRPPKKPRR